MSVCDVTVCDVTAGALSIGEVSAGEVFSTGSVDASFVAVVVGASGMPPLADSSLAPVGKPLAAGGAAGNELVSLANSRRDEMGSTRGLAEAALAPAPVVELDEGGSHAPEVVGRLLLDGTT